MKTLLLNPPRRNPEDPQNNYKIREECAAGTHDENFLPAQIYLATNYLREKGKDVDAIDAETSKISFNGYDVVVVWVVVLGNFYRDIEHLKRAKEEGKRTIMILNDANEGFELEVMQKYDFIDASVRLWEREIVLDKLISCWEKKEEPSFPGVIYRENGSLIDKGTMPYLPDLTHLTSCSKILEELPLEKYNSAAIIPGRGCPNRHTFCLYRKSGLRMRRVQDVVAEIETISTNIHRLLIIHPALLSHRKWTENFCNELIAKRIKASWRTDANARDCKQETLKKLKKAGCNTIMMGVETFDTEIKERIMTNVTLEMVEKAVINLRKAKISPLPVFYLGFPWDSDETLWGIKKFLKKYPIPTFHLRYARPWKGTLLYEECKRLGILKRELWIDDYVHSDYPMVDTLYLTKDEVAKWRYEIKKSTVLNPKYILNFLLEKRCVGPKQIKSFLYYLGKMKE